jgi:hypothetical protein
VIRNIPSQNTVPCILIDRDDEGETDPWAHQNTMKGGLADVMDEVGNEKKIEYTPKAKDSCPQMNPTSDRQGH